MKKQTTPKLSVETLKTRFVASVKTFKTKRDAVIDIGMDLKATKKVKREQLVKLLVDKKVCSESYAQTIVSLFWKTRGSTARPNNGKVRNPKAKALLAYAVKKYGKDASAILLAAYRLAKSGK